MVIQDSSFANDVHSGFSSAIVYLYFWDMIWAVLVSVSVYQYVSCPKICDLRHALSLTLNLLSLARLCYFAMSTLYVLLYVPDYSFQYNYGKIGFSQQAYWIGLTYSLLPACLLLIVSFDYGAMESTLSLEMFLFSRRFQVALLQRFTASVAIVSLLSVCFGMLFVESSGEPVDVVTRLLTQILCSLLTPVVPLLYLRYCCTNRFLGDRDQGLQSSQQSISTHGSGRGGLRADLHEGVNSVSAAEDAGATPSRSASLDSETAIRSGLYLVTALFGLVVYMPTEATGIYPPAVAYRVTEASAVAFVLVMLDKSKTENFYASIRSGSMSNGASSHYDALQWDIMTVDGVSDVPKSEGAGQRTNTWPSSTLIWHKTGDILPVFNEERGPGFDPKSSTVGTGNLWLAGTTGDSAVARNVLATHGVSSSERPATSASTTSATMNGTGKISRASDNSSAPSSKEEKDIVVTEYVSL